MAINYPQRYDDDFINIIKQVIDHVNQYGIAIQDLVADGQLTEEEYSKLIVAVNGMLKSGEVAIGDLTPELRMKVDMIQKKIDKGSVSVYDIDKNKGKFDQTFLTPELLNQIAGTAPILSEFPEESVTTNVISNYAVTPVKMNFMERSEDNLFDSIYLKKQMVYASPQQGAGFYLFNEYNDLNGRLAVVPIEPNETYTVKVHDSNFDVFRVGVHNSDVVFSDSFDQKVDKLLVNSTNTTIKEHTFTNDSAGKFLLISVSNNGQEPRLMVEKGTSAGEYRAGYVLPQHYVKDISTENNTAIVLEDYKNGYPPRPKALSVLWIGVNDPPEVEPYDEWRKTEGYTHFTDFEKNLIGSTDEWISEWVDGTHSVINATNYGTKALSINSSGGKFALQLAKVGSDAYKADSEVYIFGRNTANTSSGMLSAVHRGSGTAGSETGYTIGTRGDSSNNNYLSVSRHSGGTLTSLVNLPVNVDFTQRFHMVSRVIESRIQAKVWQHGEDEPNEWDVDMLDSDGVVSDGFVGIYTFVTNQSFIYDFGAGTGGMRAPRRELF